MRIDLAAQAKAAGAKRKIIEMREIVPTKAQTEDLARIYMRIVRIWAVGCRERVMPAYRRALEQQSAFDRMTVDRARDVEVEIAAVDVEAVRATFTFRGLIESWMQAFQRWHMRRIIADLRYATNVDLSTQMFPSDVAETLEDVLARNVALIRGVSDQARGRISDIVFRGLQNRTPARDIAKQISVAVGMSRDRALRIAMDQTAKLSSALDKERQLQIGMTSFEWKHSGKVHYRPEHLARNGKVFSWSSEVAKTDAPGFAPFCGCKAKGVLRLD